MRRRPAPEQRDDGHTNTNERRFEPRRTQSASGPRPRYARDGSEGSGAELDRVPEVRCPQPVEAGEAASKVIHRCHPGALGGGAGRGSGSPGRPGCSCPAGRRSVGSGDRRSRRGSRRHAGPPAAAGRQSAGRGRRSDPRARAPSGAEAASSRPRALSAPRLIRNAVRHTQAAGSWTAAPRRSSWAYASATESLAISASPAKAYTARHSRSASARYRASMSLLRVDHGERAVHHRHRARFGQKVTCHGR